MLWVASCLAIEHVNSVRESASAREYASVQGISWPVVPVQGPLIVYDRVFIAAQIGTIIDDTIRNRELQA